MKETVPLPIKENNQSAPSHKQRTNMQPNPQNLLTQRKSFISQMQPAPVTSTAHFKREQDAKGQIPTTVSSADWNSRERVILSKRHCVTMLHYCHAGCAVISIQCRSRGTREERQETADWRQHGMTDIAWVYCFKLCARLEVRVAYVLLTGPVCPSLFLPQGELKPPTKPYPRPRDWLYSIFCAPFFPRGLCLCGNDVARVALGYLCKTNNLVGRPVSMT